MRFLVTGGAGFIGSHLVDAIVARGEDVLILDDLSTGRLDNLQSALGTGRAEFVRGSIVDADLVDECMQATDICLHLASAVGVQLIVGRPLETLLTNVRGNDVVIGSAASRRKRLIFASTSEIYGKNPARKLTEEADRVLGSPFRARWSYSTAKAFGEALVHAYALEQGCDMLAVRLFNTTGPRQSGAYGMVLPRFVRQALSGEDVTVYGDGRQTRCFLHVRDAVDAILRIADSSAASDTVYNVGSSEEIPIRDLAGLVVQHANSTSRIRFVPYEEAYGSEFEELGRRKPDTTAVKQLTGWRPRHSLTTTIKDVIALERTRSPTSVEEAFAAEALLSDLKTKL